MACGPPLLDNEAGVGLSLLLRNLSTEVFVEMLTFVFEAIACGTWVVASVPEGATFVEVLSYPSKDICARSLDQRLAYQIPVFLGGHGLLTD